jgi:hypothetical protein
MRCDLVACGMQRKTPPAMQSATRDFIVGNIGRDSRYDEAGNVIERHDQAAGDFREFELRTTRG